MVAVLAQTPGPQALPAAVIPVAAGDGIGPEITAATLEILLAADPGLRFRPVTLGLEAYRAGHPGGIEPAARTPRPAIEVLRMVSTSTAWLRARRTRTSRSGPRRVLMAM